MKWSESHVIKFSLRGRNNDKRWVAYLQFCPILIQTSKNNYSIEISLEVVWGIHPLRQQLQSLGHQKCV